jgi:tetratricopeptide (TPR) repeat protein
MDSQTSSSPSPSFLGTFTLVFAVIAALFAIDTFLARMEESESRDQAARLFQDGQRLAGQGRNLESIERFRSALSIARENPQYELALARVLLAADKLTDAETLLAEMLRRDSTDGATNLVMARVLAKGGNTAEATSYYHMAIYGRWPDDDGNVVKARFELIDLLVKQDAKKELLAELLPLSDEAPTHVETRKRIAHLFLLAGSPPRAADIYRQILNQQPQDPDARAGVGQAEFARANYRAAQTDFLAAARLKPDNGEIRKQLDISNQILALDPTQRGLGASERYRRSVKLVELALDGVNKCLSSPAPQAVRELTGEAQTALARTPRANQQSDAMESNLDLAEKLWQARKKECSRPATAAEEPLALVMAKLAQ